jgi:stage III sporulation protein AG
MGGIIKKLKNNFLNFFSRNKKLTILVVVLVSAFLFSVIFYPSNGTNNDDGVKNESSQKVESVDYPSQLESKIKSMLMNISEISKVDVMVVCESSEIYEFLKNHEESKTDGGSSTIRDEVVYQKDGSNSMPIVISSKMPKIVGVWIIVNSISPSTKLAITNSIKSVLNLDESCISILQER